MKGILLILAILLAWGLAGAADEKYSKKDTSTLLINQNTTYSMGEIKYMISYYENWTANIENQHNETMANLKAEKTLWETRKSEAEKLGIK